MKKRTTCLTVLLLLSVLLSMIAGCSGTATSSEVPNTSFIETAQAAASAPEPEVQEPQKETSQAEPAEEPVQITLPLTEESVTLTWFTSLLSANDRMYLPSMEDNVALQHIEELTGVTIEPVECDSETYSEKLNIMIASGDCSDLLYNAVNFVSNPDQMIRDEVFLDLTALIERDMPNYQAILRENNAFAQETLTTNGSIAAIYEFVADPAGENLGLFIREDWLDELGLDVPVTYDDWAEVLAAFTNQKGATMALGVQQSGIPINETFSAGYGVALSPGYVTFQEDGYPFYQVDGQIKCGYLEDGFTEFITMMNSWYMAGYIGTDFVSKEMPDAYADELMAGKTGALYFFRDACDVLSGMAGGSVIPVSSPVKEAGDTLHIGGYISNAGQYSNSISNNCECPELAAQFIDYLYTDEGAVLTNYGVEGVSHEIVDGKPQFTDVITNSAEVRNDDNFSSNVALDVYTFRRLGGRFDSARGNILYSEIYSQLTDVWYGNKDSTWDIPDYITLSEADDTQFNSIWPDIQTLILENVSKFINGDRPLSDIPVFQDQLRQMGIEDCIGFYQTAYDAGMTA